MAELIGITVSTNATAVANSISILGKSQLPFATAAALTRVAKDARKDVAARMGKHFHLAPTKRVVKGVQFDRAEKKDWPHPKSRVGTLDDFMARQITGGIKKPEKGAAHLAVPTRLVKKTASGSIPKARKPTPFRERPSVFVADDKIRERFTLRTQASQDVRVANLGGVGTFYNLIDQAVIKPRWPFPKEVEESAASTYAKHFETEITAAVKSARAQLGHFTTEQGKTFYLQARTSLGRISD